MAISRPATAKVRKAGKVLRQFPPFEFQTSAETLRAIGSELNGYALEPMDKSVSTVWLRGVGYQTWAVSAIGRDLEFMFEVFALGIEPLGTMLARWHEWRPPAVPKNAPPLFEHLLTTRPAEPKAPQDFTPWPFSSWRTDVLRRTEIIVGDADVGPTFGDNPHAQGAVPPGQIPEDASAACDVAVGLIFSGNEAGRLLIAVAWTPLRLTVTSSDTEIDLYLQTCETVSLSDYTERLRTPR